MCKILIVDDDAGARRTLSDIVKIQGHVPVAVATGQEALDSAQISPPEIALVDLRLEDMSGLDVIKQLKEVSPTTQCVIVTGFSSREVVIQAINTGVSGYVEKPCNQEQLLGVVQGLVEKEEEQRGHAINTLKKRLEDIYNLILKTNGFAREHGEMLSGHRQWMSSHDEVHKGRDKDFRTLSNRVWALAGIDAGLALAAIVIQFAPIL